MLFPYVLVGQMQKVFSPNPYYRGGFGYFVQVDGDYALCTKLTYYANDSSFIFKKIGDNWENVQILKLGVETNIQLERERLIALNRDDAFDSVDTINIYIREKGVYRMEGYIAMESINQFVSSFVVKGDWLFLKYFESGIGYTDRFYHFESQNWVLKDEFKRKVENPASMPQTMPWINDMNEEFALVGDFFNWIDGDRKANLTIYRYDSSNRHWSYFQTLSESELPKDINTYSNISLSPNGKYFSITSSRIGFNVYKLDGQKFEKMYSHSDPEWIQFAEISNDELLVGEMDLNLRDKLLYFKLKNGQWKLNGEIKPNYHNIDNSYFGFKVDRDGERVIVGAPSDDTNELFSGAAYIFQIPARDTLNIELCKGGSYTFNDTVITTSGHYVDTLMASYGVDSVVQLYVNVHPTPRVEIDTFICLGDSIKIGEEIFTEEGEYEVVLKSQYGCDSIVQLSLGLSEIELLDSTIISDYGCGSGAIDLSIVENNPPYAFDWSTGEQGEDISGLTKGTYSVTIRDKSGCNLPLSFIVPDSIPYLIPNAFFPSGTEEINKNFKIYQAQNVHIESTQIFDRWGEKVYESEGDEYWDGSYKGKLQAPGVYLYKIVIDSPCGKETETGQILLLR